LLEQGDALILSRELKPGRPATYDSRRQLLTPAVIGCTIPEVFDDVKSGETIWFDDGKIGGVIDKVEDGRILVKITQARLRGEKLRGDKKINLPDSDIKLAALTAKDLEDLSFVVQHADIVELSFTNAARDVAAHVPVIWATQVLETLAKEGMPSRAEITDAAMGHRAECVRLNKGPHVVSAVRLLDDILRRMQTHQTTKQAMLRELRLAHGLSHKCED
jgi:pyruvate kinase